jgi:hypothetical protein
MYKKNKVDLGVEITPSNCYYKVYLIGSMESPGKDDDGVGWRKEITPTLNKMGIYAFDPTKEESKKVGMETADLLQKLNGWQVSGNWELFRNAMDKIWKGVTAIEEDPDTKEPVIKKVLGDIDFVENSDFLIWYLHENDKLGGTIAELVLAWRAGIPVYLVTKVPKSKINKSLLYFMLDSGHGSGQAFQTFPELFSYLRGKYNIDVDD